MLVENFHGQIPGVTTSILHKSCKLVPDEDAKVIKKRQEKYSGIMWIILYGLIIFFLYRRYSDTAIIWTGVLGVGSLYVSYYLYQLLRLVRRYYR
jgi:hypothetical protein